MKLIIKLIIILVIVAVAYFLLQQKTIQESLWNLINKNIPWSIPTFNFIKSQVASGSLVGLALYIFFVNIPLFPSLPAEAYVIFAFSKGTNIIGIVAITAAIYALFAVIYYLIGYLFGTKIVEKTLKRSVGYSRTLNRLSSFLIFIAYLFPIPLASILAMLFGAYQTGFRKIVTAVFIASALRFLAVILLYQYYTPLISRYLEPLNAWLKVG